jgi:hypothetical protein
MPQQDQQDAAWAGAWTGIHVSPMAQRRADFLAACGPLFAHLDLADSLDAAAGLLTAAPASLLVIDLERFEPSIDLDALRSLLAHRAGAPTLLLCPFANARWLPLLHAGGPVAYAVTPRRSGAGWRRGRAA